MSDILPQERRQVAAKICHALKDFCDEHQEDLDTTELDRLSMAIDVLNSLSMTPERVRQMDVEEVESCRQVASMEKFWGNCKDRGWF